MQLLADNFIRDSERILVRRRANELVEQSRQCKSETARKKSRRDLIPYTSRKESRHQESIDLNLPIYDGDYIKSESGKGTYNTVS